MKRLATALHKFFIPRILARKSPDRIPLSGEAGERVNCFSTFVAENGEPYLLVESFDGRVLSGKRRAGDSYSVDDAVNLDQLDSKSLLITHYYGLTRIRFVGIFDYARTRLFPFLYLTIHVQRIWGKAAQYFFNKRALVSAKRHKLLKLLVDRHINTNGHDFTVIDAMTDFHTLRWVLHPERENQQREMELQLESLFESGDLGKNGHRYTVRGKALYTIEQSEEDERKHSENLRTQVAMLFLTFIIMLLTLVQAELVKLPVLFDLTNGLPNHSLDRPAAR